MRQSEYLNIDEILEKPAERPTMDPIDEKMSGMYGKPIRASRMKTTTATSLSTQFLQDPSIWW